MVTHILVTKMFWCQTDKSLNHCVNHQSFLIISHTTYS